MIINRVADPLSFHMAGYATSQRMTRFSPVNLPKKLPIELMPTSAYVIGKIPDGLPF